MNCCSFLNVALGLPTFYIVAFAFVQVAKASLFEFDVHSRVAAPTG